MSVILVGRKAYTATLAWFDGEGRTEAAIYAAEEVDFDAIFSTTEEVVAKAKAIGDADYEAGFEVVGVVDNHTNAVIWNPYSLGTKVTW